MEKKRIFILLTIIILFILSILFSHFYYKNKYVVLFETGTQDKILNQYIKKNNKVKIPKSPKKEGYIFIEWQQDGKTYNFNNKIKADTTLTAKWLKEEYIKISYETNSDYKIKSHKILKGTKIDYLPNSYKANKKFIGWYIDNTLYNNQIINDDTILTAHYEETLNTIEYKIGDIVTISGNYASSAYDNVSLNKKAIGWNRVVLNIVENSNYPYMVGNEYGVTGFFRAESMYK